MTFIELLDDAKQVLIERREEYGSPVASFGRIARLWSAWLNVDITPHDVAHMLIQLKQARLAHSPEHADSMLDIAGYAGCLAELANVPLAERIGGPEPR